MTTRDAALAVLACLVLLGACPPDDDADDADAEGACDAKPDKLDACVDALPGAVRAPQ